MLIQGQDIHLHFEEAERMPQSWLAAYLRESMTWVAGAAGLVRLQKWPNAGDWHGLGGARGRGDGACWRGPGRKGRVLYEAVIKKQGQLPHPAQGWRRHARACMRLISG